MVKIYDINMVIETINKIVHDQSHLFVQVGLVSPLEFKLQELAGDFIAPVGNVRFVEGKDALVVSSAQGFYNKLMQYVAEVLEEKAWNFHNKTESKTNNYEVSFYRAPAVPIEKGSVELLYK